MPVIDETTLAAAFVSDALRQWLRGRPETDEAKAAALAYEAAVLIARHSPTVAEAQAFVDNWAADMKDQIATLGVGVDNEHP